ncbi:MAG TPA: flippase [Puia sp.]|nr:flippase [Puia sp.]
MSLFKKYGYWVHSGKYTALQKSATLAMGILSFMLLARILGPAGFGVWGLFLIISSITETARTALIRNAFIRFIHKSDKRQHASLQGTAFVLSLFISVVLAMIFLLFAAPAANWLKAPALATMLRIYAITMMVCAFFAHCEMLLNAKMDFRGVCWMYCIRQGLLVLLIAICYFLNFPINEYILSWFYLLSVLVGSLVGLKISSPYLEWGFENYRAWLYQLWNFGKYVFGTNFFSLLFRSTDNFITSNYFGPAVSAYYNASLRIGNLVDMPSQVLGDILFPKIAKYDAADKAVIKNMYEKTVGAIFIFSIPALLIILLMPSAILYILAGKKFLIAAPILRITVFFGFILPFLKQFGTIMDATGHPAINFRVMFFAFIFDVGANLIGVHFFGVIGAALGTATTYLAVFIVTQSILHKMFGIKWFNVFRNTFSLYTEILNMIKNTIGARSGKIWQTPISKIK